MTASTKILTCGAPPNIIREKPLLRESQQGWDEITQVVKVHEPVRADAITTAAIAIGMVHADYPNFYVVNLNPSELTDGFQGWKFNLTYRGTFDLTRRYRHHATDLETFQWDAKDPADNDELTKYQALIPRMTLVDTYFSSSEPNWAQQGTAITPTGAPTPPTLPAFNFDNTLIYTPFGWILIAREADYVGETTKLWKVDDTITYYEQTRPIS